MSGLNVNTICFDYYGTLVDIGKPFEKMKKWFHSYVLKEKSNISVDEFNMYFTKQRAKMLYASIFLTGTEVLEKSYINTCKKFNLKPYNMEFRLYIEDLFTTSVAFDKSFEIVEKLKQKYKVGLITNADNYLLEKSIKRHNFNFDFIVSSEDAKCNKPQFGIFEIATKIVNMPSNKLLMIGDSFTDDILPARSLGLETIWINHEKDKLHLFEYIIQIQEINEVLLYV